MEMSRCIPPSSGPLMTQNKSQVNDFSLMKGKAYKIQTLTQNRDPKILVPGKQKQTLGDKLD